MQCAVYIHHGGTWRTMHCRLCINLLWSRLVSVCVKAWRGWGGEEPGFLNNLCIAWCIVLQVPPWYLLAFHSKKGTTFLYIYCLHQYHDSTMNTQLSCPGGFLKSTSLLKEDGLAIVIQRRHGIVVLLYLYLWLRLSHTARIPSPLPLHVAKTGRNHLNEEFTPLLPTGIGERF